MEEAKGPTIRSLPTFNRQQRPYPAEFAQSGQNLMMKPTYGDIDGGSRGGEERHGEDQPRNGHPDF